MAKIFKAFKSEAQLQREEKVFGKAARNHYYTFVQFWPATKEDKAYPNSNNHLNFYAGIEVDTNTAVLIFFNRTNCRYEYLRPTRIHDYEDTFEKAYEEWFFDRSVHGKFARPIINYSWTFRL